MNLPVVIHGHQERSLWTLNQIAHVDLRGVLFSTTNEGSTKIERVSNAHKKALQVGMANNPKQDYVILMEDDVEFTSKDSYKHFVDSIKNLPSDWDIFLGGFTGLTTKEHDYKNVYRVTETSGFHFYAVSKRFYSKFLTAPKDVHIDIWCTSPHYANAKTFCIYPVVATSFVEDKENALNLFFQKQKKYGIH